ncbi:zf-HC2 domain-containing protein [Rhizobium sp. S163]|uniref:anti-sigma factor family protein n=1 Tax=Rhizobium sp. S163 TaxID=3055039 RepID=UPI0025A97B79|nr:zf-HC2 domain-containing protein [Rhizobium sp. S163]MDM9647494.1 zf-HC2 domain-containing protein [Rhizobium sp. S163]
MTDKTTIPSDEELTAYLDGELPPAEAARLEALLETDAELAARLEFLSRASLPFAQAFDPLLAQAPKAELEAILSRLSDTPAAAPAPSRRRFLGALAACLVGGVIADRAFIGLSRQLAATDENSEWRATVADYIALYTPETLAGPVPSLASQEGQLSAVEARLGLRLSPEAIALSGVDFKRALLLQYDDQPLAQLAYLDPETGPLALCIVRSDDGPKAPDVEARKGMNVVYWSDKTHAFMLIGHASLERMKVLAGDVRMRLAA